MGDCAREPTRLAPLELLLGVPCDAPVEGVLQDNAVPPEGKVPRNQSPVCPPMPMNSRAVDARRSASPCAEPQATSDINSLSDDAQTCQV